MKSIFATPEDLVRNLARMNTVDTGGDEELVALNRMIEEARALCEAQPKSHKPQEVEWEVSVKAVSRLSVRLRVPATSEQKAQELAVEIARGYHLEDFDATCPEDITVSAIERLP